jgi:hypothetical protein
LEWADQYRSSPSCQPELPRPNSSSTANDKRTGPQQKGGEGDETGVGGHFPPVPEAGRRKEEAEQEQTAAKPEQVGTAAFQDQMAQGVEFGNGRSPILTLCYITGLVVGNGRSTVDWGKEQNRFRCYKWCPEQIEKIPYIPLDSITASR